ncbi:hypothetical protein SLS62_007840 [Diatrype stigma]|uniref:Uncharacterized protein n=1 Tax=Diatrype stigma TaxID=117547 RepID=A0AAN9ULC0_9PEZI
MASPNSSSYSELSMVSPTPTVSTPSTEPRPGVPGFPFPATTFDPNFNPAFSNDVRLQDRGWVQNIAHFVRKHHSEGIIDAATQHFMSHLEYGSTLLDYNCLKSRYEGLRKLEDVDDLTQQGFPYGPRQVRFIQYYTMCYGVPKKPKAKTVENRDSGVLSPTLSPGSTPRISVQDHTRNDVKTLLLHPSANEATSSGVSTEDLSKSELGQSSERFSQEGESEPPPTYEEAQSSHTTTASLSSPTEINRDVSSSIDSACPPHRSSVGVNTAAELADAVSSLHLDLPVIPDLPSKPGEPDLNGITDKDERKQAEKEAKRQQKIYEQAVKSREKAVRERQKLIDKREKKRLQEAEKKRKEELKLKKKEDAASISATPSSSGTQASGADSANPPATEPRPGPIRTMSNESVEEFQGPNGKKRKERMFCSLPKTHKVNGQLDPKWVKIFMKDMDEVGAHTGLFFPGEHYDCLVGDVVDVIVGWVQEDATKRAIFAMN